MMAKIRTLELQYAMIQFLIIYLTIEWHGIEKQRDFKIRVCEAKQTINQLSRVYCFLNLSNREVSVVYMLHTPVTPKLKRV